MVTTVTKNINFEKKTIEITSGTSQEILDRIATLREQGKRIDVEIFIHGWGYDGTNHFVFLEYDT